MKMNNLITLTVLLVLFAACQEDVVLDLNKTEKKLVVEAYVSNEFPCANVSLSYSLDFYDSGIQEKLDNATVTLTDENGQVTVLDLNNAREFVPVSFIPNFGLNYTLNISLGDQIIQSQATLPFPVPIVDVSFVPNPFYSSPDSLNLYVTLADQIDRDNFFRLKVRRLSEEDSGEYSLFDDSFGNGGMVTLPVYYSNFSAGDTVVVELFNLNEEAFNYYAWLSENDRATLNTIAPGNPTSNVPENVLGCFIAYTVDRDTVIARF